MTAHNIEFKPCPNCGVTKKRSDFPKRHGRGPNEVKSICIECYRIYRRAYRVTHRKRENARSILWKYNNIGPIILAAKNNPCSDCKGIFPICCMDFDHIRGDKKFNISDWPKHNKGPVLEELKKCELVCSNCHRIRTESRRDRRNKKWFNSDPDSNMLG